MDLVDKSLQNFKYCYRIAQSHNVAKKHCEPSKCSFTIYYYDNQHLAALFLTYLMYNLLKLF